MAVSAANYNEDCPYKKIFPSLTRNLVRDMLYITMIIPGIFEKDINTIQQKIDSLNQLPALVQIDVCDNKTLTDLEQLNTLRNTTPLEIHLMVLEPETYLTKITNVEKISTEVTLTPNIAQFIKKAKELDYKVGLSIDPNTSFTTIEKYLPQLDFVQFMTIVPGAQGRELEPKVLKEITMFKEKYPGMPVQVDGGIDEITLPKVLNAGANNAVIGSQIVKTDNPAEAFSKFVALEKEINA